MYGLIFLFRVRIDPSGASGSVPSLEPSSWPRSVSSLKPGLSPSGFPSSNHSVDPSEKPTSVLSLELNSLLISIPRLYQAFRGMVVLLALIIVMIREAQQVLSLVFKTEFGSKLMIEYQYNKKISLESVGYLVQSLVQRLELERSPKIIYG